MPFIVVLSGELEIVRPTAGGEEIVATHKAGNFFGDIVMLSGRRSMVVARMRVGGQLIEMQREALQQLVQTDSELGEILTPRFHPTPGGADRPRLGRCRAARLG